MKKFIAITLFFALLACSSDGDLGSEKSDGIGGSLAIFALKGDYLYAVDDQNLSVFSILNGDNPVKVNDVNIGFRIETLFSSGSYLYIGSQNGMYIYSIENPENPQLLSAVQHISSCDPVVANATNAYVTLHSNSWCGNATNVLEVYDTADPLNPILIHSRNLVQPKGLGLYNNYLFVCDDELKIFDITNPVEPILVGSLSVICFDVIFVEDTLFAVGDDAVSRYTLNPNNIADISLQSSVAF